MKSNGRLTAVLLMHFQKYHLWEQWKQCFFLQDKDGKKQLRLSNDRPGMWHCAAHGKGRGSWFIIFLINTPPFHKTPLKKSNLSIFENCRMESFARIPIYEKCTSTLNKLNEAYIPFVFAITCVNSLIMIEDLVWNAVKPEASRSIRYPAKLGLPCYWMGR